MPGTTRWSLPCPAPRRGERPRARTPRIPCLLPLFAAIIAALAGLTVAGPAASQTARLDVTVTVVSSGAGADQIAVAYQPGTKDAEIRQDFQRLAGELKTAPPRVRITRDAEQRIPAGEAELPGLVNWSTGTVNLDAIIRTYKRFGHFHVGFVYLGSFPARPVQDVDSPPLRIRSQATPGSANFEVWINQSGGEPAAVPSFAGPAPAASGWRLWVGLGALAAVVAVSVFLIVHIILGQRRAAARQGKS